MLVIDNFQWFLVHWVINKKVIDVFYKEFVHIDIFYVTTVHL